MNDELVSRTALFIDNREIFDRVFKLSDRFGLSACAVYTASLGIAADEEKLRECREAFKANIGALSYLRDVGYGAVTLMALSDDPITVVERIISAYTALKRHFRRSNSLGLAAVMLADRVNESDYEKIASAAYEQYSRFRDKHRFRMSDHDAVCCVLLAMRGVIPDEAAEYADTCFRKLRERPAFRCAWCLAEILAADPSDADAKCVSVRKLRMRLKTVKRWLSLERELAALMLDPDSAMEVFDDAVAIFDMLGGERRFNSWHISGDERLALSFLLAAPSDARLCLALSGCLRKRIEQAAAAASA